MSGPARRAARCACRSCSRRRPRAGGRSRTTRPRTRGTARPTRSPRAGRSVRACAGRGTCRRSRRCPPITERNIGVSMKPGQMQLTRIPMRAVVDRHVLGEQHDAALRRVVRAPALGPFDPLDRRDVHDAARALRHHRDERVLAHEERAVEVDARSHGGTPRARPCGPGPPPATPAEFTTDVEATVRVEHLARSPRATAASSVTSARWKLTPGAAAVHLVPTRSPRSGRGRRRARLPSANRSAVGLAEARRRAGHERNLPVQPSHRCRPRTSMPPRGTACGTAAYCSASAGLGLPPRREA